MSTMQKRADEAMRMLGSIGDAFRRYDYLIHIALSKKSLDGAGLRDEKNIVAGCQSKLWVRCSLVNDGLQIECDSESLLILGFATIIADICTGASPEEAVAFDFSMLDEFDKEGELLPVDRRNGLAGLIERIRTFAEEAMNSRKAKF